jgi:hypothetical protein
MVDTATLLTHRGSIRVTREHLAQFDPPQGTDTWKPVKHAELVDALHEELTRRGLQVRREQYAVQKQGTMLFGTLDLDWQATGEYAAAIGLRTANDKSMSIQLAIGLRIVVCDNLCFSGDLIALKRRHTARLDLPLELAGALDRYQEGVLRLHDGVELLKDTPISIEQAKVLVYDVFRQRLVPVRLFYPVTQTLSVTVRDYGLNHWWVHNAFTTHLKALPPGPAFRATTRLGKFFSLN